MSYFLTFSKPSTANFFVDFNFKREDFEGCCKLFANGYELTGVEPED